MLICRSADAFGGWGTGSGAGERALVLAKTQLNLFVKNWNSEHDPAKTTDFQKYKYVQTYKYSKLQNL
jgi:hypothetical protein